MKDLRSKFIFIAIVTFVGLAAMWPPYKKLKLGIDLSGGTILVYETQKSQTGKFNMEELIAALKRRINPDGAKDTTIRKVESDRVEIILPEADAENVEEIKRKLTETGSLEFRILANMRDDSVAVERARRPGGLKNPPNGYRWYRAGETFTGTKPTYTDQSITDVEQQWPLNRLSGSTVELTGTDLLGAKKTIIGEVASNTATTIKLTRKHGLNSVASYKVDYNPGKLTKSDEAIIRDEVVSPQRTERFILCKIPPERQNVTGKNLSQAYLTQDNQLKPAVGFSFDRQGAQKFGNLTRQYSPKEEGNFKYHLAIVLDGEVMSAPYINSEIRDSGQITMGGSGDHVSKEVDHLIGILRSGSLPASINPIPLQEEKIGPTLGKDTIDKGVTAIIISMLVVPMFMLVYYRFAGVVAVVALVLNMILLLASMALSKSTFTLPGLAGLALTIGMAVDANVLIFERMREEKERGAGMAQMIRNGFSRAWTTILDANVCTMLSGAVLWWVGTEEIKGFALTLILGLVWNLFTAVFVSRVIFEYWFSRGWLKKLTMMKIMDKTNIDFIGPRYFCIAGSILLIAAGLVRFGMRGQGMYNIDFTGGTLVTVLLNEDAPEVKGLNESGRAAYVRRQASALPDVTVENLNVSREARGLRFNIRTTETDQEKVTDVIRGKLGPSLSRVQLKAEAGKKVPAVAIAPDAAGSDSSAKEVSPSTANHFAGGWKYPLLLNVDQEPKRIATAFADILKAAKIDNPETRFEVVKAGDQPMAILTDLEPEKAQVYLERLSTSLRDDPRYLFERLTNFGATVAGETRTKAAFAIVFSWLIIIAYLWFRFKSLTYGLAAVVALVHDVLIALGAVAFSPYKIDLPMIAAFLTLIGFSVNDTIVIFDRIREIKGKSTILTPALINTAVNETLSRTILTSLTAWLVVVIMYFFGGEGLAGFSFALVIGFLSGTYSTIYIASPILIDFSRKPAPTMAERQKLVATREL